MRAANHGIDTVHCGLRNASKNVKVKVSSPPGTTKKDGNCRTSPSPP